MTVPGMSSGRRKRRIADPASLLPPPAALE
jgi:hypothetical protein